MEDNTPPTRYKHIYYDDLYIMRTENGSAVCGSECLPFSIGFLKQPGIRIFMDIEKFGALELAYKGRYGEMLVFKIPRPGYEHFVFNAHPSREVHLANSRDYARLYIDRMQAAADRRS